MCPIFILIILHEIWNAQHEKISWTNSNQHGGRNITKKYVEIDTRVHQLFKLNSRLTIKRPLFDKPFVVYTKIQQTKMLVTCQRFGDWFLFGLHSLLEVRIRRNFSFLPLKSNWLLGAPYWKEKALQHQEKCSKNNS